MLSYITIFPAVCPEFSKCEGEGEGAYKVNMYAMSLSATGNKGILWHIDK